MKNTKQTVWIVIGTYGAYTDHKYTRKDMKQHHCDCFGYMSWNEAKAKGDKCVKATLIYKIPTAK